MNQDLFTGLPPEMQINILSRLPVRTTVWCRCVCKKWLDLLKTSEFVKAHFSKSVPGLVVFEEGETRLKPYKVFEFADELDPEYRLPYCDVAFDFSFPHREREEIHTSANGLLFLVNCMPMSRNLYICNPVTHDYIMLPPPPPPPPPQEVRQHIQFDIFGFGVSRIRDRYKVVHISNEIQIAPPWIVPDLFECHVPDLFECHVYTLGSGSWKSIARTHRLKYVTINSANGEVFLNGNYHWLVNDLEDSPLISCFDFETDVFSTFSPPPYLPQPVGNLNIPDSLLTMRSMSALGDRLCVCDYTHMDETVVWLMKDYVDKSWTKEYVIRKRSCSDVCGVVYLKVFNDVDILITRDYYRGQVGYIAKSKTLEETDLIEVYGSHLTKAVGFTPSFRSLRTFTSENVFSF